MKRIKIGDLCTLNYGKGLKAENRNKGHYPVYGSNGIVGYHDSYLVENSSIIIGRKGSIGEIHLSSSPCWPIDTTYYLSFKTKDLNINWLYRILKTLNLKGLNKSAAVPGLNREDVYGIKIPLPPLDDQIRIATVLTRAERLIAKRKESIKALDELLKSTFLEMFGDPVRNEKGWEEKGISDLCEEIVDCVNKTAPQSEEITPFVMVRTSNIRNGKISLENIKCVSEEAYAVWTRRSVPRQGDLLFTREAPMGEVGLVDSDTKIFLGQRVMQYRCDKTMANPVYLLHLMQTTFFGKQIERLGKGSTVKHLAVPDCYKFKVPSPPIGIQNQFAAIVEKVETIKAKQAQSLAELENLYASLSQRAFKGELRRKSGLI